MALLKKKNHLCDFQDVISRWPLPNIHLHSFSLGKVCGFVIAGTFENTKSIKENIFIVGTQASEVLPDDQTLQRCLTEGWFVDACVILHVPHIRIVKNRAHPLFILVGMWGL